jgi:hypothetical protein
VHHAPGLSKRALTSIAAEGRRFLQFHEPGAATREVRMVAPGEGTD